MNIITQVLLPLILAFIMFSMGLSLVPEDFKRVLKFPKAFSIGLILQMIMLPLLGFVIAHTWVENLELAPAFAVGLIVIAACPGGVTSNLMTHLGKGDTALSISLTAVISILSVFTLPIIVNLGIESFMSHLGTQELNVGKAIIGVFVITTVPVLLGMIFKYFKSNLADSLEPNFRKASAIFFIIIILAAIVKDWGLLVDNFSSIGPATLVLNLITMGVAFGASRLLDLSLSQSRAITFECGLQNGTLAIFVTATLLNNQEMMLPGGIYSILMFITGGVYLLGIIKGERQPS